MFQRIITTSADVDLGKKGFSFSLLVGMLTSLTYMGIKMNISKKLEIDL